MQELVKEVNAKLKEGYSVARVEREMGMGKDTLRQKLNRAGYSYNKALKQFITQGNTKSYNNTNKIEYKQEEVKEKVREHNNNKEYKRENKSVNKVYFTDNELEELKEILKEYRLSKNLNDIEVKDDEIKNRSVRLYINQFNKFAKYCKEHNLNQSKVLYKLIDKFLSDSNKI